MAKNAKLNNEYDRLMSLTTMMADEILRRVFPVKDNISQRTAYKEYGPGIVKQAEESGKLTIRRIGNKKMFSRRELNVFCEARKRVATQS
ncbi:MAG: hypothetical protein K6E35_07400 [Bacteroidales bacterium]|nr:hypothetical protein [Bacteroidales bacterium]